MFIEVSTHLKLLMQLSNYKDMSDMICWNWEIEGSAGGQ